MLDEYGLTGCNFFWGVVGMDEYDLNMGIDMLFNTHRLSQEVETVTGEPQKLIIVWTTFWSDEPRLVQTELAKLLSNSAVR